MPRAEIIIIGTEILLGEIVDTNRIANGKPFRYYLHPVVYEYIEKNHLYQQPQIQTENPK